MIPKSLSLVLKSAVVLFPLLAGGFLTFLGGERLYEANTVQVERWSSPFGLLAFSSTQLDYLEGTNKEFIKIGIQADMRVGETKLLQGTVHCAVYGDFQLPSYDGKEENDVYIGLQFPFRVVNPRNINLNWDDPSSGP